jgi:hypothetical protein
LGYGYGKGYGFTGSRAGLSHYFSDFFPEDGFEKSFIIARELAEEL